MKTFMVEMLYYQPFLIHCNENRSNIPPRHILLHKPVPHQQCICMCTLLHPSVVQQLFTPVGVSYQVFIHQKLQHSSLAHPPSELATRKYLDKYLASAFNLALEDGRLKAIDNQMYVLTLDYMLKVCRDCTSVSASKRTSCAQHSTAVCIHHLCTYGTYYSIMYCTYYYSVKAFVWIGIIFNKFASLNWFHWMCNFNKYNFSKF